MKKVFKGWIRGDWGKILKWKYLLLHTGEYVHIPFILRKKADVDALYGTKMNPCQVTITVEVED